MNSSHISVLNLLRRYGLKPDKRLGQNFLTDPSTLGKVVEASGVGIDDWVLEIGAGVGNLTCLLAEQAHSITAVELDDRLIPVLEEVLQPFQNVNLIQGDILELNITDVVNKEGYLVVANIPYYITSALIRHLLESELKPASLTLTLQREVAQRICAVPGDMSLLALSVQAYGEPKIMGRIPAGAFYPPPKVDSAIVHIDILPSPLIPSHLLETFFRLAKAGFSQKRKTLRNALSGGMRWSPKQSEAYLFAADIDPKRRAQTLSLEEWGVLAEKVVFTMETDP